jgi:hypothetical protein
MLLRGERRQHTTNIACVLHRSCVLASSKPLREGDRHRYRSVDAPQMVQSGVLQDDAQAKAVHPVCSQRAISLS